MYSQFYLNVMCVYDLVFSDSVVTDDRVFQVSFPTSHFAFCNNMEHELDINQNMLAVGAVKRISKLFGHPQT